MCANVADYPRERFLDFCCHIKPKILKKRMPKIIFNTYKYMLL